MHCMPFDICREFYEVYIRGMQDSSAACSFSTMLFCGYFEASIEGTAGTMERMKRPMKDDAFPQESG